MNINSTVELSFDLTETGTKKTVSAKQRDDKTRSITVKLTQNGKPFEAPEGAEIKLSGTKPDSTVFEILPDLSEALPESCYTFILTDFALSAVGNIRCEVKCSWDSGHGILVCSTEIFYINNIGSAIIPEDANVKAELQSVEQATAQAKSVANSLTNLAESLIEARDKGEFNGTQPVRGVDYWTEEDKAEIMSELSELGSSQKIPDYWEAHLAEKIKKIKSYQSEGGKDCFSFIVMSDLHYESNLGKRAPAIAKRIMDECGIKYALCLGDVQTRHGANHDADYIAEEWENIEDMLSPIRDRLLITQGNHDGSYGIIDNNNDNVADDINGDGTVDAYDKNVFNCSPNTLYDRIFRKVGVIGNVKFSEDGRGYYIDDEASRVRYILLNSHVNSWEQNPDGTVTYNNMHSFRFGQAQYNMVIEALSTIPSDGWSVIVGSHVPLDRSGEYIYWGGTVDSNGAQTGNPADCIIMQRLLNAYKRKTSYTGSFSGTHGAAAPFSNYANKNSSDWVALSYINSSGAVADNASNDVTNFIPVKAGDTVRLKNCSLYSSGRIGFYDADKNIMGVLSISTLSNGGVVATDTSTGITTCINLGATLPDGSPVDSISGCAYVRFVVATGSEAPIITVNEDITDAVGDSSDAVYVNADFTGAKGEIIAYFGGHVHKDSAYPPSYSWNGAEHSDFYIITTRCDGRTENTDELRNERVAGTVTEQSFDVFTIDRKTKKLRATKIGAGSDRAYSYV